MSRLNDAAYAAGQQTALSSLGLKEAGWGAQAMGMMGKGLKWGGRLAGTVPAFGTAANAVIGGAGGLATGIANQGFTGKGLAEGVTRAGANIATGSIPGGAGIVAGMASDAALDHAFAKPPTAPGNMSGLINPAHSAPGMVA